MGSKHSSRIASSTSSSNSSKFIIGIIYMQNDFCKGGKLAVSETEETIYLSINCAILKFIFNSWCSQKHNRKSVKRFERKRYNIL